MTYFAELLNGLIDELGWALSFTGFGIVAVGMLYLWGKRDRRLALVIFGALMLVVGQTTIALHQGSWRLAFLAALLFGICALVAILGQVVQSYLIEPWSDNALLRPRGPLGKRLLDWLREPGNRNLKRFLFPRIIDRLYELDK